MGFESKKQKALSCDNSKKGSLDKRIIPLLGRINARPGHFTTSSCSGRILVLKYGSKKKDAKWLFSSHEQIEKIPSFNEDGILWLKVDPLIVHICCRTIESASRLLANARTLFRRAGIISIRKEKITVEIQGSEKMELPWANEGRELYSKETQQFIIDQANMRLERMHRQIREFEALLAKQV